MNWKWMWGRFISRLLTAHLRVATNKNCVGNVLEKSWLRGNGQFSITSNSKFKLTIIDHFTTSRGLLSESFIYFQLDNIFRMRFFPKQYLHCIYTYIKLSRFLLLASLCLPYLLFQLSLPYGLMPCISVLEYWFIQQWILRPWHRGWTLWRDEYVSNFILLSASTWSGLCLH